MALLAEELVEEWLNRDGFFTIRGVKIGVQEMDLLAIRPSKSGLECRHIEVQASINPVSYLFRLSKADRIETGRSATSSAKRTPEQLARGADDWVQKKFHRKDKKKLLLSISPGPWTNEVVLHNLKFEEEVVLLEERGVKVHRLGDVIESLTLGQSRISRAAGGDFMDLVFLRRPSSFED